jgi:hypothetical protein
VFGRSAQAPAWSRRKNAPAKPPRRHVAAPDITQAMARILAPNGPAVALPAPCKQSVHGFEAVIARAHTRRRLKFTLPGPMTIVDTIADAYHGDKPALAMAFATLSTTR